MNRKVRPGRRRVAALMLLIAFAPAASVVAESGRSPRDGWRFKFKDFVIAGWCPPSPTDAEYRFYKDAGFNLVMGPRYPLPGKALDLARKHGMMLVIDTYTHNDKPWGSKAGKYTPHPLHHPATLPELEWLHARYGKHPALAGYLLGDDYGALPRELIETSDWMRKNTPHLFPWICQNVFNPASLARHGNPLANPQIYPTLYNRHEPVERQAEMFCERLDRLRRSCNTHDLISWPMFNVSGINTGGKITSDSLVRFQVYASLAYGAQGIWYFTYRGYGSLCGGKEGGKSYQTEEEVKRYLDPKWHVAKTANHRVAGWGAKLLGRTAEAVYHTGKWPVEPRIARLVRIDEILDFKWQTASPGGIIPKDQFSVRWSGHVRPAFSGTVKFHVVSDDGARLWVDGKRLVDCWQDQSAAEHTGMIDLTAGKPVPIKLHYYEKTGEASLVLSWSWSGRPREIVPSSCLFVDAKCSRSGLRGEYRSRPSATIRRVCERPGAGKLIVGMSDDLMVGVLRKSGRPLLAMVVDKRVDKHPNTDGPRQVELRFADTVKSIAVLEKDRGRTVSGASIKLTLPAGGGQLLELR